MKYTRAIIDAIHHNDFDNVETIVDQEFGVEIPTTCPNVPDEVLIPRNTWEDKEGFAKTKSKLIALFQENFKKFEAGVNPEIVAAGPKDKSVA